MDNSPALIIALSISGLLATLITALLNRPGMSKTVKSAVALVVALVIGVAALALTGELFEPDWYVKMTSIVGVTQVLYAFLLEPSGVAARLERVGTTGDSPDDPGTRTPAL